MCHNEVFLKYHLNSKQHKFMDPNFKTLRNKIKITINFKGVNHNID